MIANSSGSFSDYERRSGLQNMHHFFIFRQGGAASMLKGLAWSTTASFQTLYWTWTLMLWL